ncbi:AAA family ATPase [Syntrophomonas erecta]
MKEIAVGSGIALVIFLALIGVNVTPFVLFAVVIGGFYFFMQNQGQVKFDEVGGSNRATSVISFEEIGGQDTAIKELKEALQFLLHADAIKNMGIRPLKGILLVGPPGTGKTLLARAAASFTSSAFIAASGSEFIEMYAGVGAKRIRQIFRDARKKAMKEHSKSAIIFIDELDVLGARRGSHSGHMEYDQTLNQLLVEMDGISKDDEPRILIIGATNRADMLDPAILRPGRFDRQVQVGLPDRVGRRRILNIHTRNKPVEEPHVLEEVARATFGFSGAHLESLANEAAILAMREGSKTLQAHHFMEAIDKVMLGEKLDKKPNAAELERVSVHESGHALVSEMLDPGSVASLTIIPRGGALGFMRKSPRDDQYLYTRAELENQIMVSLAGALSEELRFGNRSTGARNDFSQAWDMAREIIEAGMSSLGIVNIDDLPAEAFYNECRHIISALEERTREILRNNLGIINRVAETVMEEEVLNQSRFQELVG